MKGLIKWLDDRFPLLEIWKTQATNYYLPKNLNFFYLFGSIALVVFFLQFITGLWLIQFYTPTVKQAFNSIELMMREVNYGWLFRYTHSTGASAFFIVIYLHLFKAFLYGSYQKPRELIWLLGMALYLLLLAEAFCGYLLPWGQMSYWSAQVITSLFSAIPSVGEYLVLWLRGDYQLGTPTLHRFFALHVLAIPLLMLLFVLLHLIALRHRGSNNPEGIEIQATLNKEGKPMDGIPFHPFFVIKDFLGILVFLLIFFTVVFFFPEMGGLFLEPENFVKANPLITPESIAPVWYMTPFYAILRTIPNKLMGIVVVGFALELLLLMPWLDKSPVRSMRYKGRFSQSAFVLFILSFCILGYLGKVTLTPFKQYLANVCTLIYFAYFLFMPIYTRYEKYVNPPERIKG